jgi:hypothetical protein
LKLAELLEIPIEGMAGVRFEVGDRVSNVPYSMDTDGRLSLGIEATGGPLLAMGCIGHPLDENFFAKWQFFTTHEPPRQKCLPLVAPQCTLVPKPIAPLLIVVLKNFIRSTPLQVAQVVLISSGTPRPMS